MDGWLVGKRGYYQKNSYVYYDKQGQVSQYLHCMYLGTHIHRKTRTSINQSNIILHYFLLRGWEINVLVQAKPSQTDRDTESDREREKV